MRKTDQSSFGFLRMEGLAFLVLDIMEACTTQPLKQRPLLKCGIPSLITQGKVDVASSLQIRL